MTITTDCTRCDAQRVLAVIGDHAEAAAEYRRRSRQPQPPCGQCGDINVVVTLRDIYGQPT